MVITRLRDVESVGRSNGHAVGMGDQSDQQSGNRVLQCDQEEAEKKLVNGTVGISEKGARFKLALPIIHQSSSLMTWLFMEMSLNLWLFSPQIIPLEQIP